MLDTGLLLSGAIVVLGMSLATRAFSVPWSASETLDRLLLPAIAGVLAGRGIALLLDDPTSLRTLRTFLVIRGGVEFWAGALAAVAVAALAARRAHDPVLSTLAHLAPVATVGYAAFEAACLVREGCYGPHTAVGLRPDGIATAMLPLGVLVGAGLTAVAIVLARRWDQSPLVRIAVATLAVGLARSVASVWLPRIGDGLTRQHRESIVVVVLAATALLALQLNRRRALT